VTVFAFTRESRRPFALGDGPRTPHRNARSRKRERDTTARGAGKILLLGSIRELALYRTEYLQGKGYEVIAPSSRAEALETIRRGGFEAAILTYTLPNELVLEYAQLLREYCPPCPLVVITDRDLGDRNVAPDAIVIADHGPDALLRALRRLLNERY
jgi:CheY-like chemotaxis protein